MLSKTDYYLISRSSQDNTPPCFFFDIYHIPVAQQLKTTNAYLSCYVLLISVSNLLNPSK